MTDLAEEVDLAQLLGHASHVLATELTARLAEVGLTQRGYGVLARALPGDLTQIRLADLCGLDKTTMVVMVDELERAGLVERRSSPGDRRVRIIAVTDEGRRVAARAREIVDGVHRDVLAVLPAAERAGFVNGLSRLVEERLATPVHCERPPRRRA